MKANKPHGNELIDRLLTGERREKAIAQANELPKITISRETILDIANIAQGAFSPLQGFVTQNDFLNILHESRLENNLPFTVPVTCPLQKVPENVKEGDDINLFDENDKLIAQMHLEQIYTANLTEASQAIFGTQDLTHPGVKKLHDSGNIMLAGEIDMIGEPDPIVPGVQLTPKQTRAEFEKRGWKTITGFQTRNVPHRAHEYLQKAALELTDGILLHPLIGWKKKGDYTPEAVINGYKTLIEHYYPKNSAILSALTTQMRYAGPREAVFHAIIRKNFGCTHFIVGRDHAGVGSFYKKYEAQEFTDKFDDLGIEILKLKGPYFCKHCDSIATEKTCPHPVEEQIEISGTLIRDMLSKKEIPPKEFMRKEVAQELSHEVLI
jgi:sulfate adenylyltransferase